MLEACANDHGVRFFDAEGVTDDTTFELALMCVCIASHELREQGTPWAMTGDNSGIVVVAVMRKD